MLPEISLINGKICDFEKQFGVTFTREKAAIETVNGINVLHLLAYEWTNPTVGTNKRIISLIGVYDPLAMKSACSVVVLENSGTTYTGYEIWDINSNVLDSGSVSTSGPYYGGGATPDLLWGLATATVHDVSVSITIGNPTEIRVQGTADVELFGLLTIDLYDFDETIIVS